MEIIKIFHNKINVMTSTTFTYYMQIQFTKIPW